MHVAFGRVRRKTSSTSGCAASGFSEDFLKGNRTIGKECVKIYRGSFSGWFSVSTRG